MADLTFAVRLTGDGDDLQAELVGVSKATEDLVDNQKDAQKSGKDLERTGKRQSRMWKILRTDVNSLQAAFAGLGLGLLARDLAQVGLAQERWRSGLLATVGDARLAAEELGWLREQADRVGVTLESIAQPYVSFRAAAANTNLTLRQQREIFTSVIEAGRVFGLSAFELEGALLAVEQMISKGTVSAEELRGQLGERLPGAFQAAARAMNVTTEELGEMLQRGEVLAEDLLPLLAREFRQMTEGGLAESTDGAAAAFARLANAIRDVKIALIDAGALDAMQQAAQWARDLIGGIGLILQREGVVGARSPSTFSDVNELQAYIRELEDGLEGMRAREAQFAARGADITERRAQIMERMREIQALRAREAKLLEAAASEVLGGGGEGGRTGADIQAEAEAERVAKAFQDRLTSLLGSLNLQSAAFDEYRANLDLLAEAHAKGKITTEQHEEAVVGLTEAFALMADEVDNSTEQALLRQQRAQTKALQAMQREQQRAQAQMVRTMERFGHRFSDGLVDALSGARTSWQDFLRGMLLDASRMLLRRGVSSLIQMVVGAAAGGAVGQPAVVGGQVMPWFHGGGVVGSGGTHRMTPLAAFAGGAQVLHNGGMAGDVPAILRRGEEVLTRSDPRHRWNGGGGITQNITIDARGAERGVEARIRAGMAEAQRAAVAQVFAKMSQGGAAAKISGRRR